ncbi:glycosyltransferase [uncultured Kocuria sp.]|uniref:glycosyltransferase family 2 protein n=1 Tax=uncultured Kocuria sp. TaxID=259305 RepID=UPI002601A783|nr:glycosyltransferase [uncultured Kocuria sp.]
MTGPKISVIMPVRNGLKYLENALTGIESLEFDSWELIIVDDGSTDGTADVLRDWSRSASIPHLIIENAATCGVAIARNAAVAEASGEFVWFVDGDDSWSSDILFHLWSGVSCSEVDMVVCDARRVVAKTGHTSSIQDAPVREIIAGEDALQRILRGELQGHLWNKLIRRARLEKYPFPAMRAHSDLAGIIRLVVASRRVAAVPGEKYFYDVHDGSILQSADYKWENLIQCAETAEEVVEKNDLGSRLNDDLRLFTWSHVMIPAANSVLSGANRDVSKIPYRANITPPMIYSSWRRGHLAITLKAAALRWSPQIYGTIYRRHHAKKWGSVRPGGTN